MYTLYIVAIDTYMYYQCKESVYIDDMCNVHCTLYTIHYNSTNTTIVCILTLQCHSFIMSIHATLTVALSEVQCCRYSGIVDVAELSKHAVFVTHACVIHYYL